MVSGYFAAMIWGAATYTMVYTRRKSHEECFDELSTPRYLVTVSIIVSLPIPAIINHMTDFQYIIVRHNSIHYSRNDRK